MSEPSSDQDQQGESRAAAPSDEIKNYFGKYIAIIQKTVVASGSSYEEALKAATELYPGEVPYVTYTPPR